MERVLGCDEVLWSWFGLRWLFVGVDVGMIQREKEVVIWVYVPWVAIGQGLMSPTGTGTKSDPSPQPRPQ